MANHRIIDRDSAHLDPVQHYHVARFIRGGTNQSVILPRRGPETFQPRVMYWVACACLGLFVVCDNPPASSKPASSQCLRVALTYYAAHCPSSFPGCRRVSKAAAEKRWQRNFNALEREQRMPVDEDGNDAGMANRQHCHCFVFLWESTGNMFYLFGSS